MGPQIGLSGVSPMPPIQSHADETATHKYLFLFEKLRGGRSLVWPRTLAFQASDPGSNPGGRTTRVSKMREELTSALRVWLSMLSSNLYEWVVSRRRNNDFFLRFRLRDNGFVLKLPGSDTGISKDLLFMSKTDFVFREPYYYRINLELSRGRTVYDIGANIGYFSIGMGVYGSKRIYSFEPNPLAFKYLEENVKLNNLSKKVYTFRLALGREDGLAHLDVCEKMNLSRISDSGMIVEMRKLDSIIKRCEWPNMIRMDVEGYEYEILRGGERWLESCDAGSVISMEFHPSLLGEELSKELLEMLCSYSFLKGKYVLEISPNVILLGKAATFGLITKDLFESLRKFILGKRYGVHPLNLREMKSDITSGKRVYYLILVKK